MTAPAFRVDEIDRLSAVADAHPFALLLSAGDAERPIAATPLPVLRRGPDLLVGHLARGNPQAAALDGAAVTVLFQGPHAYVSPRWYAASHAVPTWDYVLVRAHGAARLIADDAWLDAAMAELSARFEGGAWRPDLLPETMRAGLRRGIVGVEIAVARWEGTFKLSQNRSAADRAGVAAALAASADSVDRATGALVAATLDPLKA